MSDKLQFVANNNKPKLIGDQGHPKLYPMAHYQAAEERMKFILSRESTS
jgi:hypothetical protein